MGKPTPGPWHFVPRQSQQGREHSDWVVAGSDGHDWICLGPEWDADCCDEASANARLIAAAPDLLDALTALSSWVNRAIVTEYTARKPMPDNCRKALEASAAAIARATGEA